MRVFQKCERVFGASAFVFIVKNSYKLMTSRNEEKWNANYLALKEYILAHGHLPDKKKVENRGLLNWWKYNKKCGKLGKLSEERADMLQILSDMRDK